MERLFLARECLKLSESAGAHFPENASTTAFALSAKYDKIAADKNFEVI